MKTSYFPAPYKGLQNWYGLSKNIVYTNNAKTANVASARYQNSPNCNAIVKKAFEVELEEIFRVKINSLHHMQ